MATAPWFLPIGGYPSPAEDELAPPEPCAACKALEAKSKTCWRHKPEDSMPVEEVIVVTTTCPDLSGTYDYDHSTGTFRRRA